MNKNKLIFIIIGIVGLLLIFWGVILLNSSGKTKVKSGAPADFTIWTYGLDKSRVTEVVNDFKSSIKAYENKNIVVENFTTYEDYKDTLIASIVAGKAPDVFMLNNFEKSFLENYASGINPSILNPNDFRKIYKPFLGDDLIRKGTDDEGKEVEFVSGIPVGYETLGIYYNRKYVLKPSDLESWAGVSNLIDTIKERDPDIVPLGIMNGKIDNNPDVITQFFMFSDGEPTSLDKVTEVGVKEAFGSYFSYLNNENISAGNTEYGETEYYNVKTTGRSNLELFSEGNEAMIIGYTSMINSIEEAGFNNSFLYAAPFPHYFSGKGKTLVKYNYFVVNQTSLNSQLAYDFLVYLSTEKGATNFLSKFTYLLPALVTLEQDKLQEKIHDGYNLVLGDFYKPDEDSLLASFNKVIYDEYDDKVKDILKDDYTYLERIKQLQKILECKYKKLYNIENLSKDCTE